MHVRDRILEAALGLLAESGAHELTQPKVSKAAGVRQSRLTYYFPTRADLLQAVAQGIAAGSTDRRRVRVSPILCTRNLNMACGLER
ncbi:MAG: TetR/AcrR family transcriptional regulator [Betaproteobacteria bacterium]|nr:TetR/AcrR family transcriptional regulator [Betaproteobacteria bacterium]